MNNSTRRRDYYYYQQLTFNVPVGILAGILILGLILLLLTAIITRTLKKRSKENSAIRWEIKFFLGGAKDAMLRITNFLLFEFEHQKEGDEHIYLLYGVQVRSFVLQYLFIVLLAITSVCTLSFWNTFLAEATIDDCEPTRDCYPIQRANQAPITTTPITDCEKYPIDGDTSILCFELVFRYSEGLGEAGGFLFSMQVVTNILIYTVVRMVRSILKLIKIQRIVKAVKNGETPDEERIIRSSRCVSISAKLFSVLFVETAYILIVILLPIWILTTQPIFMQSLKTFQRQLQLFLYEYTFIILSLVPPIVGVGIHGNKLFKTIDVKQYGAKMTSQKAESAGGANKNN